MSAKVRLSKNELIDLIESTEAMGNDATDLRWLLAEVEQGKRLEKPVNQVTDEEHVEALRKQSTIEHGINLECMVCHEKFDKLISGTCEACFRKWALATKKDRRYGDARTHTD